MSANSRRTLVFSSALALISVPLLTGSGCPPQQNTGGGGGGGGNQATTLLDTTQPNTNQVTFNPTAAGKTVNVTVSGDVSGSRVRVVVRDNLNAIVAQDITPTTNSTAVSFTSSTTGTHRITMTEAGTPSTTYTILVTQEP